MFAPVPVTQVGQPTLFDPRPDPKLFIDQMSEEYGYRFSNPF